MASETQRTEECFAQRQRASAEISELDAQIKSLAQKVGKAKKSANELAGEFRQLYEEAKNAYAGGNGEQAKKLSQEGHQTQGRCQELNKEVGRFYSQLKELNNQRKGLVAELKYWHNLAMTEMEKAKALQAKRRVESWPKLTLRGIPPEYQRAVADTLRSLPARHVSDKLIERISYSNQYIEGKSGNSIQANSHFSTVGGKTIIVINKQTPQGFINPASVRVAVIHEIGHVVYRKILNKSQRNRWTTEFTHSQGHEESFAVSYWYYYFKQNELAREFPSVKAFFDQLNL